MAALSQAGIGLPAIDVHFTRQKRTLPARLRCPLCTISGSRLLATLNGLWAIRLQCLDRGGDVGERYYTAKRIMLPHDPPGKFGDGLPSLLAKSRRIIRKTY